MSLKRFPPFILSRRQMLGAGLGAGAAFVLPGLPAWAQSQGYRSGTAPAGAQTVDLTIAETPFTANGRTGIATTVNGSLPGPLLRFREGEEVTINVSNRLDRGTSIHWHGILLPADMDGVPGLSFRGIGPGRTFTYRYRLKQAGTYWYHSHSGLQEQSGHYGPLVVDPAGADPIPSDREHVILLSDWTFENPEAVFAKLKKMSDYYNRQQPTVGDFFRLAKKKGLGQAFKDRMMWGTMRMMPSDIADVTGETYTYLMNGHSAAANWTGLFAPGERVRLRFINGSAMTYFNVRIPGLTMTVVQADGQDVAPVEVDEFQIGVAETFDVVVTPREDAAYTVMAESMDRSGYVRGTLAPRMGMAAAVPPLREPPKRTMADMGMDMAGMDMDGMDMSHGDMKGMDMSSDSMPGMDHGSMDHGDHTAMDMSSMSPKAVKEIPPPAVERGPGVANVAESTSDRLAEPGTGLKDVGHRVLVYADLKSAHAWKRRPPDRHMELHLTGNMERYMWSFDGIKFSEVKGPILFRHGERMRLTMVNDTMMEHPIHLHGMWMELDAGYGDRNPRKHTISVKPAERLSVEIEADAPGDWAFHCHLLYHMHAGMFRVVRVGPGDVAEAGETFG